jgi:hypothetical protein
MQHCADDTCVRVSLLFFVLLQALVGFVSPSELAAAMARTPELAEAVRTHGTAHANTQGHTRASAHDGSTHTSLSRC